MVIAIVLNWGNDDVATSNDVNDGDKRMAISDNDNYSNNGKNNE